MAKKQIVASAFNVTAAPEDGVKGSRGQLPYPAGEYDLHTSYICTDMVAPYVLYNGIYYVMNQITTWVGQGVPSNINNPQKDYAINGKKATWIPFENYKAIYVEILMANFAKLASAVFSGDYMFSQQGVDAEGNSTSSYEKFGTANFIPNLLFDFQTGSFKGRNVEVEGTIIANASFVRMHDFRANEGYFFLNPAFGSEFRNGRPNRNSQSMYMLPEAVQYNGMKISLIIYNTVWGSTYGYTSVVTTDGFNELTFENNEYHYCNKIAISKSGVYEFMSLGTIWILTKGTDVSYSYVELLDRTYEDPIN